MALVRASFTCHVIVSFVAWWYLAWYTGQPVAGTGVLMHRLPWSPDNWTWLISNTRVFSPASEIMCAAICQQTACVAYNFNAGACTAEGVGEEEDLSVGATVSSMFRTFTNAAFGKVTYSGTHYGRSGPGNAVNNLPCQKWGLSDRQCCFSGYIKPKIWWLVDLGASRRVHIVDIAPGNGWHFASIEVRVGKQLVTDGMVQGYQILGSYPHVGGLPRNSRFRVSNPEGIVGRYVSVEQNYPANLVLCDVLVLVSD